MLKLKDTGRLTKNIISDISGNILGKENSLVIIEKWTGKKHLIVTDTETKQTFEIKKEDINIDYPDVTELYIQDLINKGWKESELTKVI